MVDIDASLVRFLVHLHTAQGVPGIIDVFACILGDRLVDTSVYFFSDISLRHIFHCFFLDQP